MDPPDLVLLGAGAQPVCGVRKRPEVGPASEVYLHEMPGGQFTNLKAQARSLGLEDRWHEIAQAYADANQMFGDIVKVTPSSKVVGDMALMMVSQDLSVADVENPAMSMSRFPTRWSR
jgi:pyruvate carboxylase